MRFEVVVYLCVQIAFGAVLADDELRWFVGLDVAFGELGELEEMSISDGW